VAWTREERAILDRLDSPAAIQAFLDTIPYSTEPIYRCPRSVLRDHKAHCFDGAVLAAAALRRLGERPLLVDLRAVRDDDHVIAVYRLHGHLGAVVKSNFVGLRFREPVYRSVRELVMSYFDSYYNSEGERTLREHSAPFDLRRYDRLGWMFQEDGLEELAHRLNSARHYRLLTPRMEKTLTRIDDRSFRAGMLGLDPKGLYDPRRSE